MNNLRRKTINSVIENLETLKTIVEQIRAEEEDAYQNLPVALQESDKGEAMDEACDHLDYACDLIADIVETLNSAKYC